MASNLAGPSRKSIFLFALLWLLLALASLLGGPAMGEHEVIVAQIARQCIQSGDWVVLRYLDTPFLVKPPLSPWLVAAASLILPPDHPTGLPVSAFSARLPSMIATFLTLLVILALGRSMFGRRTGTICAFVYATSVGALLFAYNATAEAMLTLFCTWSFAEFWWFYQAVGRRARRRHLVRFYLALGLAMLAKGPMPMSLVVAPIAVWWWCHRPGQIWARGGIRAFGRGLRRFAADLWPRFRFASTRLGLWWGVPLFALMFLPWMLLVARRVPYVWELWDFEYLDRIEGRYPGVRSSNLFYYVPILLGLLLPWTLSVPEALAGPLLKRYRKMHKPLAFAWYWVIVGVAVMSAMSFKKSYYVLPAAPGLALLLGPPLERLFFGAQVHRLARFAILAALGALVAIGIIAGFVGRGMYPEEWNAWVAGAGAVAGVLLLIGFGFAGRLYLNQRGPQSLACVGLTGLAVFTGAWFIVGPHVSNIEYPMQFLHGLQQAGIPADAELYWAGNRPDGRVQFYGNRPVRQVMDPYKLVAESGRHFSSRTELRQIVGDEICRLMAKPTPVYCVLEREDFQLLVKFMNLSAREVFSVDRGRIGPDMDDWVVCANAAAPAAPVHD